MSDRTTRSRCRVLLLLSLTLGSLHPSAAQDRGTVAPGNDGEGLPLIERVRAAYAKLEVLTEQSANPVRADLSEIAESATADIADHSASEFLTYDATYAIIAGAATIESPQGNRTIYTLQPKAIETPQPDLELSLISFWELAQESHEWYPESHAATKTRSPIALDEFDRYVAYSVRLEVGTAVLIYKAVGLHRSSTGSLALLDPVVPFVNSLPAELQTSAGTTKAAGAFDVNEPFTMRDGRMPLCHRFVQLQTPVSASKSGTTEHLSPVSRGSHQATAAANNECICGQYCRSASNPVGVAAQAKEEVGLIISNGFFGKFHLETEAPPLPPILGTQTTPSPTSGVGKGAWGLAGAAACVKSCFLPVCDAVISLSVGPAGIETSLPSECLSDATAVAIVARPCPDCEPFAFAKDGKCEPGETVENSWDDCATKYYAEDGLCRIDDSLGRPEKALRNDGGEATCKSVLPSEPRPANVTLYPSCYDQMRALPVCDARYLFVGCKKRCTNELVGETVEIQPTDLRWGRSSRTVIEAEAAAKRDSSLATCEGALLQDESCPPTVCGNHTVEPGETLDTCCFDVVGPGEACVNHKACLTNELSEHPDPKSFFCQCTDVTVNPPECGPYTNACGDQLTNSCPPTAVACTDGHCVYQENPWLRLGFTSGITGCDPDGDHYVSQDECLNNCGGNVVETEGDPVCGPANINVVAQCGNGRCDGSETCSSCQVDCGVCPPPPPVCGDGSCNGSETCASCAGDCGACNPTSFCGDHKCDAGESCASCIFDCGACPNPPASCGNGLCEAGESCGTCSADCGTCSPPPPPPAPVCGDRICNGGETCATCGQDCGASCTSLGARCGTMINNGCGFMLNCGTCPGGATCTADHRCLCSDGKPPKVWYLDCDKDGLAPFWATGPAYFVQSCAKPTAGPASCPQGGWTSRLPDAPSNTDCFDLSAVVKPGQTEYFQTGYTVDGRTSFDYDCDGRTTFEYGVPTSATTCSADSGFCEGPVNYLSNGLPATPACGAWTQISFCDQDPNNPLRCVRSRMFTYAKCR